MTTAEKLVKLRCLMSEKGIDTYIMTKNDPHMSEYSPSFWNQVEFISGFTGSSGDIVVTQSTACLWTDGRYYIQAAKEIAGTEFILQKSSDPTTKDFITFAKDETKKSGKIGFDGRTLSSLMGVELENKCKCKNITLTTEIDLLCEFWRARPTLSNSLIFEHTLGYCGENRKEKLKKVREYMTKNDADVYVISSNDDIAWLLNLRGNDMPNISFFAAYVVIDLENVALFVHKEKTSDVTEILANDEIILKNYSDVYSYFDKYDGKSSFLINPEKTCYQLFRDLERFYIQSISVDITTHLKSVKNAKELKNLESVNIRDGVAMVRFTMWLEENKHNDLSEYEIGRKLDKMREKLENFAHLSFDTIAAYNENAAIMHYSAKEADCSIVKPIGMLLVDSGGNFLDGTTDITRTFILGAISHEMKRDFTLVLKSHIALSRAIFLYGATGSNLDVLARTPMWENSMDYKSGTGHGIGFFLNVHEGPQRFSQIPNTAKLEVGMIITIEPGVYREGKHGIRTENTVKVMKYDENEFGRFLNFETISFCPIDKRGIDSSILDDHEKKWLNDYHQTVFSKLSPFLNKNERSFLKDQTTAI